MFVKTNGFSTYQKLNIRKSEKGGAKVQRAFSQPLFLKMSENPGWERRTQAHSLSGESVMLVHTQLKMLQSFVPKVLHF